MVIMNCCNSSAPIPLVSAASTCVMREAICWFRASAFGVAITCLSLASRDTEHRITNPSSSRRFSSLDAVERRI